MFSMTWTVTDWNSETRTPHDKIWEIAESRLGLRARHHGFADLGMHGRRRLDFPDGRSRALAVLAPSLVSEGSAGSVGASHPRHEPSSDTSHPRA